MFWVKTHPQVTIMFSQDLKWPSIPVNHSADLKGPGLRYSLLTNLLNLPLGFLPPHFLFYTGHHMVDDNDDIGAQVSEYDDYEYELKKEGVSEERTDGAYISVKFIPHICHLYHL